MTSPSGLSTATSFALSGDNTIDALVNWGVRWGSGGVGTSAVVSYSFPQSSQNWLGGYGDGEPFDGFQGFNAAQQNAARRALALWSDVANITFQEVPDTAVDVGDIRFGFSRVITNSPFIAWGYFPETYPEAGDIWFDRNYTPNLQMAPGQFGFSTLLHEIGHAIGLDHPFDDGNGESVLPASMDNNQYTIMAYDAHPTASVEAMSPMLLDILAIQHLYGANMTTRIGNDVYKFSTSEQLRAIWDAGGIDTIDASNQTLGAIINLNEGTFSSIGRRNAGGSARDNIAIAYGVTIENAKGGSGNDKITGNAVNNELTGNAGNDTLDGGIGADTLRGGQGSDIYVVDHVSDVVDEQGNKDLADEVRIATSINLATFAAGLIERATALGSAAIDLTGNKAANILIGNAATNIINGGAGADMMKGGAGNDVYFVDIATDQIDEGSNKDSSDEVVSTVTVNIATLGKGQIEVATLVGTAAINATGNALNNLITGNSGANTLNGAGGDDMLRGLEGNDTLTDTLGNNYLDGGNGNDKLTGGAGRDTLIGGAGNDTLTSGAGNDLLDGGAGNDVMTGGAGNDTYFVDNANDKITESGTTDLNDRVMASISVDLTKLGAGLLEHANLLGTDALTATGNSRNNMISGNAGANILIGDLGNDVLDGGLGADKMLGGKGNDVYIVDDLSDVIDEQGNTDIADHVTSSVTIDLALLAAGAIEHGELFGVDAVGISGNAADNKLWGNGAANMLDGREGNDTLIGQGGDDTLIGGVGNDVLDGGTGNDTLKGGSGNDQYIVDSAFDVIDEDGNGDTADEVRSSTSVDLSTLADGAIENVILLGAGSIDAIGNAAANSMTGNAASNTLDGREGADVMRGGAGNDIYVVDDIGDVIDEQGKTDSADEVRSANLSLVLTTLGGGAIENAALLGSAALAITGSGASNRLHGNDGANTIEGGAGNDFIDGGAGADILRGGAGNDIYRVDLAGDVVDEQGNADSDDEVQTALSLNLSTFAGGKIEHGTLLGSSHLGLIGNASANILTGNSADNVLDGGGGSDILRGGSGNDTYIVDSPTDIIDEQGVDTDDEVRSGAFSIDLSFLSGGKLENATLLGSATLSVVGSTADNLIAGNNGNNILSGGAGDDVILGGDGNDYLDGNTGADTLKGGDGNDTYVVDSVSDVVDEGGSASTGDLVLTTATLDLSLSGQGIENATALGVANVSLIGNALKNVLIGNAASNLLDGGGGNDILKGGAGSDIYILDSFGDVVDEEHDFGTGDEVRSASIDLNLSSMSFQAIENGMLLGSLDLTLAGTALTNVLIGNDGNNTIDGFGGSDQLFGGKGNDTLIGTSGDDVLNGEDGNDTFVVSRQATTSVAGGAGFDTYVFAGQAGVLDLDDISSSFVIGIDRFDLTGFSKQTLLLDTLDPNISDANSLIVTGDAEDTLTLEFGYSKTGTKIIGGTTYDQYTYNDGEVLVEQEILTLIRPMEEFALSDLLVSNAMRIGGGVAGIKLGSDVSPIGDLNDDGYDDLLIGSANQGKAYVVFGSDKSPGTAVSLASLGTSGFTIEGGVVGTFAAAVAGIGDVNGDGLADIAIGDKYRTNENGGTGGTYVVYGDETPVSQLSVSGLDGDNGFVFAGGGFQSYFGADIGTAGDFNGDGLDDLVIGAAETTLGSSPGEAYIVLGSENAAPIVSVPEGGGPGAMKITWSPANSYFGSTVSTAGDFNGDGYDDVIVGMLWTSRLIYGRSDSSMPSAFNDANTTDLSAGAPVGNSIGDVNGDGYDDFALTTWSSSGIASISVVFGQAAPLSIFFSDLTLNGTNGFKVTGFTNSTPAVIGGDFNADGYDDLLIGDSNASGAGKGYAYVIYGSGSPFSSTISSNDIDGLNGFRIYGTNFGDLLGAKVNSAGDINGDGFDDIAIAAPGDDFTGKDSGTTYVIHGDDFRSDGVATGTTSGDVMAGSSAVDRIAAGQGNDVVHGNGGADAINGGQGDDEIHVADNKFFRIDGGTGVDALHLDYAGTIDFGNLDGKASTSDRNRIENVETIDVDNGQANALTLHLADVLDLDVTNSNLGGVADLDNVLRIDGNSGDTLQMFNVDGWGAADTASLSGYAIYTYQAVKVAVDTDIVVSMT